MTHYPARLVTLVVGAGPAGLLFCALARLSHLARGGTPAQWPIILVDKRTSYARTHRLRIDPKPYRVMRKELDDPRLDALLEMLEAQDFKPVVNELEEALITLVEALGIHKEQVHIGDGTDQTSIATFRQQLIERGTMSSTTPMTVVGADSVHSTIREMVRGDLPTRSQTHQQLVRLRIEGDALPERLNVLNQVRLSKLLNSLLDYRKNRNGFAEVDLFLSPNEHSILRNIDANPRQPVLLDRNLLKTLHAPLFKRIVRHLQQDFGDTPCKVYLYSSFKLEHQSIEQVSFAHEASGAQIFLVGDAAVSLPFFRGMAALGSCAHALAGAMADLVEHGDMSRCATRYDREVQALVQRELATVKTRGRLIDLVRESSRISAMLPFPIQSWFLSVPEEKGKGEWTTGVALNLAFAVTAATIALLAPLLRLLVWKPLAAIWLIALPIQMAGGFVYYATRLVEPGPDQWIKRVWRVQIIGLMILGALTTLWITFVLGQLAQLHISISWFLFGIPFIGGMYIFEWFQGDSWTSADLEE